MPVLATGAALLSALTWGLGSHLFGRLLSGKAHSRTPTPAALNLFKNALAGTLFLASALFVGVEFPPLASWPPLLASGFFGFALGDTLYFAALPRAGIQVSAMSGLVHVPATALLAYLLFGDEVRALTLACTPIVLLGVWLVILDAPSVRAASAGAATRRGASWRLGIVCALAAALAQSVSVAVGHRALAESGDLLGQTLVRMIGGISGSLVIALAFDAGRVLFLRTPASNPPRAAGSSSIAQLLEPFLDRAYWKPLAIAALFGSVLGLPLFHFALRELDAGVASILFSTTPLFTLPLGLVFAERHGPHAWIGTVIGFVGVALVVWTLA